MTEHTLMISSLISFLEPNKRQTQTAVHKSVDERVKSNIHAEEVKRKLDLQFMTGFNSETDDKQLHEIKGYCNTH